MLSNLITLQSAGAEAGGAVMMNIIMIVALIAIFYLNFFFLQFFIFFNRLIILNLKIKQTTINISN